MSKKVYGVDINDLKGLEITRTQKEYRLWRDVLKRCYDEYYLNRFPTYRGCSVAEEWLLFSNFKRDIVNVKNFEKSKDGWVLDKDLCSHTKTYSKETCCFIPDRLNLFISNLPQAYKAPYDKRFDVYYSYCNDVHGKRTYLGRYKSKEEACEAYLKFKALVFLDMIEFYKDDLDEKILTRLKNIGDNYCESVS